MMRAGLTRRGLVRRGGATLGWATLGWSGVLPLLAPGSGQAEPAGLATEWTGQKMGRVRLVAARIGGTGVKVGKVYAGVHVRLAEGWKTYWRLPGESGVPPSFDWAGSVNLGEARVLYPVPMRLPEAGMISLGYKGEVVFPVEVTPRDPGNPVELKLAFEYGVCKDICIPAEARLALVIPADGVPADDGMIGQYLARVPLPAPGGGPAVSALKAALTGSGPHLTIDAIFPRGSEGADALVEIAGGELAPLPVVTERKGRDAVRFDVRFASAAEAQRFAGKALRITLFSANAQAELDARIP